MTRHHQRPLAHAGLGTERLDRFADYTRQALSVDTVGPGRNTALTVTAPDLTTTSPRSGRDRLGDYAWLGRLADKARAESDGKSDAQLVAYFDAHVDEAHRNAANTYVLDDMKDHLNKQDAEEGRR